MTARSETGGEALARRVGTAIARERKAAGYTQSRVADAIGVEKETVSRFENGVIAPTIFRLTQLAELFGCPISVLFGEYKGRVEEDAVVIAEMLSGLSEHDRRTVIRIVSDFAAIARPAAGTTAAGKSSTPRK